MQNCKLLLIDNGFFMYIVVTARIFRPYLHVYSYWPDFPAISVVTATGRDFPAVTFPALGNVKSFPLGTGRLF